MRILILALVAACTLPAQVHVSCAAHHTDLSKTLFTSKVAKRVRAWTCELKNQGSLMTTVDEAQLVGWMIRQGRIPLSTEGILVGAKEMKQKSFWSTAGRISVDAAFLATAFAAGDIINVPPRIGTLLGFGALSLPKLGDRLASREPSDANFDRVAFSEPVTVPSGGSVQVHMFSEAKPDDKPVTGWLDLLEAPPTQPVPAIPRDEPRLFIPSQSYDMRDLWASAACRTIVSESEKVTSYPVDVPELWAQARQQGLLLTTLWN